MRIAPCPKCGRIPKIVESCCAKNGARRRIVSCPNTCIISFTPRLYYSSFVFIGDGDDNTVYKLWNEKVITSKDA